MKRINNFIATRILGYRGFVSFTESKRICPNSIICSSCGKKVDYTLENAGNYQLGHKNCPEVLIEIKVSGYKQK